MRRSVCCLAIAAVVLVGCTQAVTGRPVAAPAWTFDATDMDRTVRPGDDFFLYTLGTWHDAVPIVDEDVCVGVNMDVDLNVFSAVDTIVADAVRDNAAPGEPSQLIADLYRSYNDQSELDRRGIEPVRKYLSAVDAISDKKSLDAALVKVTDAQTMVSGPFPLYLEIDPNGPTRYLPNIWQGGLSMEERDFYLDGDADSVDIRDQFVEHVDAMLTLAGYTDTRVQAERVLALETALAEVQWPLEDTFDPDLTSTVMSRGETERLAAGAPLKAIFDAYGLPADTDVLVGMPDVLTKTADLVAAAPLQDWQAYLRYQVLAGYADYLSQPFQDESFNFYERVLYGIETQGDRDFDATWFVSDNLGDLVGERYVAENFDGQSKPQLLDMVETMRAAYADRIEAAQWMSEDTRREALAKLSAMVAKIGYPEDWVSYDGVTIVADDLVANIEGLTAASWKRSRDKLGKPLDREAWDALAQENNAFYDPQLNDITFTAAILQPPFFDPDADPAANYGGIAATIGHEMTHAFDSDGRKADAAGTVRVWWTPKEVDRYEGEANLLVDQYDAYEPLPDEYIDGELTLAENIADLVGLQVAYDAYRRSLEGREAPVIDGLTGDQRFFIAYAASWKEKCRDEYVRDMLQSDPHSPPQFRVDGVVRNMDEWYDAFDVKEGDELYLEPEDRVRMW